MGFNVGYILNLSIRQMWSKLLSNNATTQHMPNHVPIVQITTSPRCCPCICQYNIRARSCACSNTSAMQPSDTLCSLFGTVNKTLMIFPFSCLWTVKSYLWNSTINYKAIFSWTNNLFKISVVQNNMQSTVPLFLNFEFLIQFLGYGCQFLQITHNFPVITQRFP